MKTVNYYSVEVKYYGDITDYTKEELFAKAQARIDKGVDPFDYSKEYSDEIAKGLDGFIEIEDRYPCNKLAIVKWCYIEDLDEE